MAISDFVLVFNFINQDLALLDQELKNGSYNFWSGIPATVKDGWMKYFAVHSTRIGNLNPEYRITP